MTLRIAQKTLERLEWPQLVGWLRDECRTPQARAALQAWLAPQDAASPSGERAEIAPFASTLARARERLAETSEARALLDQNAAPGLSGLCELDGELGRAARGSVLAPTHLRELAATLECLRETAKALLERGAVAPRLAALAELIAEHRPLERAIDACIARGGEVRDDASPALRHARDEARGLGSEIQKRIERMMRSSTVRDALSDDFYTVRGDRYVLPVRSEARSKVPGIIHDASGSGTTVYIEPQALVDLNNRLKQAELDAAREVERVLRELSRQVAEALPELRASLEAFALIDFAFARGRLSQTMEGVEPLLERDGLFDLKGLRHPLIASDDAVPNDLRIGGDFAVLVLSGPNAGGKTVAMKSIALAALLARAGLHVPALPGARVAFVDQILADIGDEQDIRASLSTFSAHMLNLSGIVKSADANSLVVLDEIGVGTDPNEGAALAQSILEALADNGARVVTTTHYSLLKEMAANDERFLNASVEFDPETLAPTYRIHLGTPGASSAAIVAARMGMPSDVLERAAEISGREEHELEQLMAELAANRASLANERRQVAELQAESEGTRDAYRAKLEQLETRRDNVLAEMKLDLERAFSEARGEIAGVVRTLQRGPTQRDATRAHKRLEHAREQARQVVAGLAGESEREPREAVRIAIDWENAQPGDSVVLPGGVRGVLEALPDRRGRVEVRAGSGRLVLPAQQLMRAEPGRTPPKQEHVRVERAAAQTYDGGGGTAECDLRGMRVEEALAKLDESIDRAVTGGRDALRVIHGIGTGALRSAVRSHLATLPYIAKWQTAASENGGEGVTEIQLAH